MGGSRRQNKVFAAPAFDALLDAGPDALLALDADGTILLANTAASRLFGYSRDELTGRNHWMLLSEGFHNETALLRAHLVDQPDEPQPPREVYGRHRDGTEFAAEIAGSLLDDGGSQVLLVSVRAPAHRKAPTLTCARRCRC